MRQCKCGQPMRKQNQLIGMFIITEWFCPLRHWYNAWRHSPAEMV